MEAATNINLKTITLLMIINSLTARNTPFVVNRRFFTLISANLNTTVYIKTFYYFFAYQSIAKTNLQSAQFEKKSNRRLFRCFFPKVEYEAQT